MTKRVLPLLLALAVLLTAIAAAPADADVHTRFTFADKPVAVVLITEDQDIVDYTPTADSEPLKEGERYVKVIFNMENNPFTSDEMLDMGKGSTLTDAQGNPYTTSLYAGVAIAFGNDGLSLADEQKQFGLIFTVPEEAALDTLTLTIDGVEEPIALSAFGEANFPAETEAPTEAAEATEAPSKYEQE